MTPRVLHLLVAVAVACGVLGVATCIVGIVLAWSALSGG